MAGVSIDDFGALFIKYMPGVTSTRNNKVVGVKLARNDYKWQGEHIEFVVEVEDSLGAGYTEDGGATFVAGKPGYVKAQAFRRFLGGTAQATAGTLATAASSENAAIDAATSQLRSLTRTLSLLEGFFFYRDGTGVIGRLGTGVSGTTWGATDARLLRRNLQPEVYPAATLTAATLRGTVTINSVARALDANGDFAVTSAAALPTSSVATDYLVWPGALNRAVTGLQALINNGTGTFQAVDQDTYPHYTSPVLSNSGVDRALTPTLIRQMMATIQQESGEKRDLTWLSNTWQGIELEELYEGELRLTPDTKTAGMSIGSFQSVFGKVSLVTDPLAPYNQAFFADFSEIYRAVQAELHWRPGSTPGSPFRPSNNAYVYIADALEICEYFIRQRNTSGRIDDLSETVSTAY